MATIRDTVVRLMPVGTRPSRYHVGVRGLSPSNVEPSDDLSDGDVNWSRVPGCPTDCFAVSATLMDLSGAYHYIRTLPFVELEDNREYPHPRAGEEGVDNRETPIARPRTLTLNAAELKKLTSIGRAWSLMLPFLKTKDERLARLREMRRWLFDIASQGHNAHWFDEYFFQPVTHMDTSPANEAGYSPALVDAENAEKRKLRELRDLYKRAFKARRRLLPSERAMDPRKRAENEIRFRDKISDLIEESEAYTRDHDLLLASIEESAIQEKWDEIWKHRNDRVFRVESNRRPMIDWWEAALRLTVIADEASLRMGLAVAEYFDWFRLYIARKTLEGDLKYRQDEMGGNGDDALVKLRNLSDLKSPSFSSVFDGWNDDREKTYIYDQDREHLELNRKLTHNFAGLIDWDLACVFPKSRTPPRGCTIRNLSHHLALLPGRGIARASLRRGSEQPLMSEDYYLTRGDSATYHKNKQDYIRAQCMNVLIIPFPFSIDATSFRPSIYNDDRAGLQRTYRFDVDQVWLRGDTQLYDKIVDSIEILIRSAEREGTDVNAVILPEMALNYPAYARLVQRLATNHPKVEWLISGISQRPRYVEPASSDRPTTRDYVYDLFDQRRVAISALEGREQKRLRLQEPFDRQVALKRPAPVISGMYSEFELLHGNFVATTSFLRYSLAEVQTYITTYQAKHHRWVLDEHQIKEYNLASVLDPKYDWWENIETASRSVEFNTFRGGSTLVALCCEDLARLEPCQNLIRATGPNLVVALLMDGAQIVSRWPARYSTVLADDPGSSVLTLTSSGLMSRTSLSGQVGHRVIGLWKHSKSKSREIELPSGAHACLLRLSWTRNLGEISLDGRSDSGLGTGWQLEEAIPIHDSELTRELSPEFTGRR